jgi:hypothetical protein
MESLRICEFCQKSFDKTFNCARHTKICKHNPAVISKKQNDLLLLIDSKDQQHSIILNTTETLLREQLKEKDNLIEYLKEQLKEKDVIIKDQLKEKDEMIKNLIDKISIPQVQPQPIQMIYPVSTPAPKKIIQQPIQEVENIVIATQEEPDKAVEPKPQVIKFKNPTERYIKVECKEALTMNELITEARTNFKLEDFKKIASQKYERKYTSLMRKVLESIPKEKRPIQIKCNKPKNEEGYVKTEDGFKKYYGNELFQKIKEILTGNGKNNIQNIMSMLLSDFKETSQYRELKEEDQLFCSLSILGFEENDEKDMTDKKVNILQKSILDLFMI